jgi:hypothetical protein
MILERVDASQQEVLQHHHQRQAMAHQVLDPLNHGLVGPVQLWDLLPIAAPGRRGLGWQHQVVMDVGSYDHPVFSPVVPLARADECDVHDRALGPKLDVVGIDKV